MLKLSVTNCALIWRNNARKRGLDNRLKIDRLPLKIFFNFGAWGQDGAVILS